MSRSALSINIERIRLSLGLKKTEFGERLKATGSLVLKWEKGVVIPTPERLKIIAELGNMTVDELLGNGENTTIPNSEYKHLKEIEEKYNTIKALVID